MTNTVALPSTVPASANKDVTLPECITQAPNEPAGPDYLAICAVRATEIADSIHCPPECGGHPVCKPCLALAVERGLVVRLGSL